MRIETLKALHVVGGLGQSSGGPSYSVPRLCQALKIAGVEPSIFTLTEQGWAEREDTTFFPQIATTVPLLRQSKLSPAMYRVMRQSVTSVDIVHSHGLWIAPNFYAGQAAAYGGKSLVVSPRGMLSPGALQFSRLKKRIIWKAFQGPAYRKAATWHATSADEAADIRAFGIMAPIAIIPNGIDLPIQIAPHLPDKVTRTILFLSRIHPKKGLPTLLDAWQRLSAHRKYWQLVIAGPDEGGHRSELEAIVRNKHVPRVVFTGPVYGSEKEALLIDADLFVLPTLSENFGIAVAEALAAGIPSIVAKGAPWQGLENKQCGWWVDQGTEPLLKAMLSATELPAAERQAMGLRGRAWMKQDFGWDAIGRDMKDVYLWLTNKGPCPTCVDLV